MAEPPGRREVGGRWRLWRAARRADRLIRTGRPGAAWALVPRLPLAGALRVAARLAANGWSPPAASREVFERVLPAAWLDGELIAPFLSGAALPLGAIPGGDPVSALSFAPDAPTLVVARYGAGVEIWDIRRPLLRHRHPSPDPETGPAGPAPPTLLPAAGSPLFVKQVLHLTGGRVLATAGRATGPYQQLLLAQGDTLREVARLPGEIVALLPLPDGTGAALTGDGQLWIHSRDGATHRAATLDLAEGTVPLWGATCSPDGRLIAVYSHLAASLHDRSTGRALARTGSLAPLPGREEVVVRPSPDVLPGLSLRLVPGRIGSLAFRPAAAGLVAGTIDGAVRLLDLDFQHQGELPPHPNFPAVLAAPDGGLVVTTKAGVTRLHHWPPSAPLELRTGADPPEGAVALSPRGWLLATAPAGQPRHDAPAGQPHRGSSAAADAAGGCQVGLWDLTAWVLNPLLRRPLGAAGPDAVTTARRARDAAGVYRAGDPTILLLDALVALLEPDR